MSLFYRTLIRHYCFTAVRRQVREFYEQLRLLYLASLPRHHVYLMPVHALPRMQEKLPAHYFVLLD